MQGSLLPFSHLCAGGQIPLAKSNGAGNWSGRETISKVRSAGAGEQWLCDIPSCTQCASYNWKAFVIWLPFDYDVQDVNTNTTGVTMAEDRAHTEFPSFTSQFRSAWLLITRKQYLTVPLLTLWIGLGQWGVCVCLFSVADSLLFFPSLC